METEIIYNEDGTVNVEATIQKIKDEVAEIDKMCEDKQKEINALKDIAKTFQGLHIKSLQNSKITDATMMLITALKTEDTVATLKPYNPEKDKERSADILNWVQATYSRVDEDLIDEVFVHLFFYDCRRYYVSEIKTASGEVIYKNDMPANKDCVEIFEDLVEKYGKVAGLAYLNKRIDILDSSRIYWSWYATDKNHLVNNVQEWFDVASKCVYPQRVQQLAKHLLICATEPDVGEDEFSVYGCYKTGVEALKMLNEGKTVEETIDFLNATEEKGLDINMLSVYYFLLKYGKEAGVQIFEEKVMKPASKRGEDEISYSDYHGTPTEEVKKMVIGIKEENKKFETQLKEAKETKPKSKTDPNGDGKK